MFIALPVVLAFVAIGICSFLRIYSRSIDASLYKERLNQMREVTAQLFSGLEDVVKNHWRTVETQSRTLQKAHPATVDGLIAFMGEQAALADMDAIQCDLVAVGDDGWYYTQNGRQGLLQERSYLSSAPAKISFVSNQLTNRKTRMLFLRQLEQPITLSDGTDTVRLTYCGLSQDMDELNPYFECAAYGGTSSVYVVDDDGLKLFSSSSGGDLLRGYNVFSTLGGMAYLHGTSFDDTMQEFNQQHTAYSNAILDGTELLYAIYKMDSSAWTLIFLVPSASVATNTVALVSTTIQLVMAFATVLVLVSSALIYWVIRWQQQAVVAAERWNSARLTQLNRELAKASKAKSDFLANMSHDIRTPMNAIVGITNLMAREPGLSEHLQAYIAKVQLSSRHLLSLINDVLDMSKIESSEVELNRESVSFAEIVGQVDSIIRSQTNERGQEFQIRVHGMVHEYVISDGVRLRQLLINLLSNATKYTPQGGKIAFDLFELPCDKPGYAAYRIVVEDNGYGMEPEFVQRIFEPFTRAENSTTNKVQGTGLGMAIAKSIVDLMGGEIKVDSTPNVGTRFEVNLAMEIDRNADLAIDLGSALLISDDAVLRKNMAAAMKEANVRFYMCSTKEEAAALLAKQKMDVVMVNGHMDDVGIADKVAMVRRAAKDAVCIFFVDYIQSERVEEVVARCGVDSLIPRPFFLSNLLYAIEHHRQNGSVPEERGPVLTGMRFLCAEDNELNAEILTAILEAEGASCTIYPNGRELVDAFASVRPGDYDAILMDVQMPVMNGLEATREIRKGGNPLGGTIPIIAMTANAFTEDIRQCLDAGMNAHVSKPLDVSTLERTLRDIFSEKFSGGDSCAPEGD